VRGGRPADSDVSKTTRFKTKAKTKTVGPVTTYSLPTVNEIIFYSTVFAHYQLHNQIHMKVLKIKYYKSIHVKIVSQ